MVNRWKLTRPGSKCLAALFGALTVASCSEAKLDFASLLADDQRGHSPPNATPSEASHPAASDADRSDVSKTQAMDGDVRFRDATVEAAAELAPEGEPELTFDGAPVFSDYVRLTHQQWENSVVANLRLTEPTGYVAFFSADEETRYANNESVLFVRSELVADYQVAAANVAATVASDAEALARVSASTDPVAFIAEVGRRFYRRPLTEAEQATYLALYERGKELASVEEQPFAAGVQLLLEVWMQAPNFLYRVEHSEGELNGYELATRLAFMLTDTTPSDGLLDAAETGELASASGIAGAARELISTLPARLVFRRFHDETFELGRLTYFQVNDLYGLGADLNLQLSEATHYFFDRQFDEGHGLRELLTSDTIFTNANLATLYGVPAPTTDAFEGVVPSAARRGLFAQLPFLMLDSGSETPNTFTRGGMIVRNVLCQTVPSHPPSVTIPPPDGPPQTNREFSNQLVAAAECQACHRYIDPFGFAFENFDGLGRARTLDVGLPIDTTGSYPFVPSSRFADSPELMNILANSPLAHGCYAKQLTEFALARLLDPRDAALVSELGTQSLDQDASLEELVVALVSSETFRSAGVAQ